MALNFAAFLSGQTVDSNSEADLGMWKVKRLLYVNPDALGDGMMSDARAKSVIGRTVVLSKTEALIDPFSRKRYYPPNRKAYIDDRDGFLGLERVPPNVTMGLPKKVTVFAHAVAFPASRRWPPFDGGRRRLLVRTR